MSQSNVRKLLGYSPKDPLILSESDADDVVDAYKELVSMARGAPDFEDMADGVASFLDTVSDLDEEGQIEKKFLAAMKGFILSDDFKDQVKSVLTVVGESRMFAGNRMLAESLEDLDAQLSALGNAIKMSRDFQEVASEVSEFLGKLREMNQELGDSIEGELVNGMADFMVSMKKVIISKAKKLGAE